MMLIKGKKAGVTTGGSSRSGSLGQKRLPDRQKHWPGLLPSDPAMLYGLSTTQNPMSVTGTKNMELFKKELKMPAILNGGKPQTAKIMGSQNQIGQNDDSIQNSVLKNLDQYTTRLQDSFNEDPQQYANLIAQQRQRVATEGVLIGENTTNQHYSIQDGTTQGGAPAGFPINSIQPSFQTSSIGGVQGIGPGGVELTSFFLAPSQLQPQLNRDLSPPKVDDAVAALESAQRSIQGQGEFSPDQTNQFTILKAKLFNPMLNAQVLKEEVSQTTSNGSVIPNSQPNGGQTSGMQSGPQTAAGPHRGLSNLSPYLSHQKIDEHHNHMVQNFQHQYMTNSNQLLPSLLGAKYTSHGSHANSNMRVPGSGDASALPSINSKQGVIAGTKQVQTTRHVPSTSAVQRSHDLGRQLKHKKDMQQLKFYQTLTSQAHVSQTQLQGQPAVHPQSRGQFPGGFQPTPNQLTGSHIQPQQRSNNLQQHPQANQGNQTSQLSGAGHITIPFNGVVQTQQANTMMISTTRTDGGEKMHQIQVHQPMKMDSRHIADGSQMVTLQPPTSLSNVPPMRHSRAPSRGNAAGTSNELQIQVSSANSPKSPGVAIPNSERDLQSRQSVNQNRPQTGNQQQNEKLLPQDNKKGLLAENQSSKTQGLVHDGVPTGGTGRLEARHGSNLQEKSYTQNISEGSRDETMILKPQNILNDTKNTLELGTTGGNLPVLSQYEQSARFGHGHTASMGQTGRGDAPYKAESPIANQHQLIQVSASQNQVHNQLHRVNNDRSNQNSGLYGQSTSSGLNKRRQLLSIDSNNPNKRSQMHEEGDGKRDKSPVGQIHVTAQGFTTLGATLNATISDVGMQLQAYDRPMIINQQSRLDQLPQELNPAQAQLIQKQKQQYIHLNSDHLPAQLAAGDVTRMERFSSAPAPLSNEGLNNLIIKKCELSKRANMIVQETVEQLQKSAGKKFTRGGQRDSDNAVMLANTSEVGRGTTAPGGGLSQTAGESVMNVSVQQQKREHTACQRFLDRGNKPVPPNYEEQDVLPLQDQSSYAERIKVLYGTQPDLKPNFAGRAKTKFNLGEFDEEINGVNLSKLFMAYGPSSIVEKDAIRRNRTQAGPRHLGNIGSSSSPNSLPRTAVMGGGNPSLLQGEHEFTTDEEDEQDEENPDFSGFDEPIVIRLMTNMFSQKKSVQEGLEMLPEISLEKLRAEFAQLARKQRITKEKSKREQMQYEWLLRLEKFIKNFPNGKPEQSCTNLELMEYGRELSEIRQNPFYVALQANREEKDRLQKIKEMQQQMMMIEPASDRERAECEEEYKLKAKEQAKTDIFKHTFVDAENLEIDQEISNQQEGDTSASTDIMNRPPKDVFTFMNLNFDLPVAYYQSFGDFNIASQNQRDLIKDFMLSHWPVMNGKKLTFRIAFDKVKQVFNVILLGKNCPLSKCCKMTVCFQFDREIGGKVICMETLCPYNPMDQFFMPNMEMIEELFRDTDIVAQTNSDSGEPDNTYLPGQQHPKMRKIMAREVSKTVSRGMHKNGGSIRGQLFRSSAVNQTFTEIQYKQRNDVIAQLFSEENALAQLHNQIMANHPAINYQGGFHPHTIQEETTIEDDQHQYGSPLLQEDYNRDEDDDSPHIQEVAYGLEYGSSHLRSSEDASAQEVFSDSTGDPQKIRIMQPSLMTNA